jgi:hypothetical protein
MHPMLLCCVHKVLGASLLDPSKKLEPLQKFIKLGGMILRELIWNYESKFSIKISKFKPLRIWYLIPKDDQVHTWCFHYILEPMLGRPFDYSSINCSKSPLMKDLIPFLNSYAHSFTTTYTFLSL